MEGLYGILSRNDRPATIIVTESVLRLLRGGGRYDIAIAHDVLEYLSSWLDGVSVAAFTARRAYTTALTAAADVDHTTAQRQLALLTHDSCRPSSARLLRGVLAEETFRMTALTALESLLRTANVDGVSLEGLDFLIRDAVTGPGARLKDLRRIRHYLARWSSSPRPSKSAGKVLEQLPQELPS